jgi:hypothetical protein
MPRRALGEPPRVHEHERRAMLVRERRETVVDLAPRVARKATPRDCPPNLIANA